MKAMLALGASHLNLIIDGDMESQALTHRIDAMKLLNKALSRPALSKEEADARFATFMVLTFQSTCIPEGFTDFLTMLRGCVLNGQLDEHSYFKTFTQGRHVDTMNEIMSDSELATIDTKTLGEAVSSLAKIEPLCKTQTEKKYHSILTDVAVKGYTSPQSCQLTFPHPLHPKDY
jgi:hypothetical protein